MGTALGGALPFVFVTQFYFSYIALRSICATWARMTNSLGINIALRLPPLTAGIEGT